MDSIAWEIPGHWRSSSGMDMNKQTYGNQYIHRLINRSTDLGYTEREINAVM
jgi:hypothetical protein